jgi:hypothetical protein
VSHFFVTKSSIAFFIASLLSPWTAFASVIDESILNDASIVGQSRLTVLLWDIYDASLYAKNGIYHPEKPFALSLRYLRDFEGKDIAERSIQEIKAKGLSDLSTFDTWRKSLLKLFPDVSEGDEIIGVYGPDKRSLFYLNGNMFGSIDDVELGRLFFDIWLGDDTSEPRLRRELLGIDD